MRIAFIEEALALQRVANARVILVDCDDATRASRLKLLRNQPELADTTMMAWASYLRDEAARTGCEVLDTGEASVAQSVDRLLRYLT